jgi:tight adherence protein B
MRRPSKPWLRVPPLAIAFAALLVLAGAAQARVRIGGVDASGYPQIRTTVVTSRGQAHPRMWENDRAVPGATTVNLGKEKSVVLAVDRSRSMKGRALKDAAAAASTFVKAKGAGDRVMVVTFGHRAFATTDFAPSTTDATLALQELTADRQVGTALWDAVVLAANRLRAEAQPGHVIIVLTDGHDVSSMATLSDAVAAAHKAHAAVYPVAIAGPDFTPGPLRELAHQTGGSYHQTSSSRLLGQVYKQISNELARTWEVSYPTAARPGDELRLEASVPGAGSAERTLTLPLLGSAPAPPPQPSKIVPRSAWSSALAPLVVAGGVGFLILLACAFWAASREGVWLRGRLAPHLGQVQKQAKAQRRNQRKAALGRLSGSIETAFANVRHFRMLQRLIERADVPLRAPELLYIGLGVGVVFGLIGSVATASPLGGFVAFCVGLALPVGFVWFKATQRIKAFDNQLPDLLITIAASLKAGHSFRQGIQSVVDEGAEPSAKEFKRVLTETRLGRPMDEALAEMATRCGSKNLAFVITAVTIQRQIGGSLAGLFDMVADTVRQRQQFARKIRGLTAQGRLSAWVLFGLPFVLGLAITVVNPKYMAPLYHTGTGHMLMLVGVVMMTFGMLILRKIVSFKG